MWSQKFWKGGYLFCGNEIQSPNNLFFGTNVSRNEDRCVYVSVLYSIKMLNLLSLYYRHTVLCVAHGTSLRGVVKQVGFDLMIYL